MIPPVHGLTIVDARLEHAGAIAEIYNETVAARDATMDLVPRQAGYFARIIDSPGPGEALILLQQGETIAGWGRIMAYSDREGYMTTCETAVYLRRSFRRQGLGTLIKHELIRRCREHGFHHLVAKVYSNNAASIEYNLKLGYEIVGTQREVGWVNGVWQDVTIMQLLLDSGPTAVDCLPEPGD